MYQELNKVAAIISDMNQMIRYYTENPDLSDAEKKENIKKLTDKQLEIVKKVTNQVIDLRSGKKPGYKYSIGETPKRYSSEPQKY